MKKLRKIATPTREDCFQMSGRLKAIEKVLSKDASEPLCEKLAHLRTKSRAEFVSETISEACELLETVAMAMRYTQSSK